MLLGMLMSLFLTVGWFASPAQVESLRAALRAEVTTEKKLTPALAAVDKMVAETQHYEDDVRRRMPELERIGREQKTARAAFDQLFGSFDADRVVAERRIL
ncbi:MAG: hypothetical protein ABI629_22050, partial [bacterium]